MKTFIAVAALVAAAGAAPNAAVRSKWHAFKSQHGKEYHPEEEAKRMAHFEEVDSIIQKHNERFARGEESFSMGHNHLSDISLEEIKNTRMGVKIPDNAQDILANVSLHVASAGYQHPAALDWRTWNGVQYVKNQGSCGSCYTFSAIGALETAYWRAHNYLPDLSEQHLVDCTGEYGNGGCQGGWMHTAFKWIQDKQGACYQKDYPYTGVVGTCQHANKQKAAYIKSYTRIPTGNEAALLDAVATTGTVSIAYNAGTQAHSYYNGGILDVPNCGNNPTHAVTLVGYGTENGKDFWILKNSWGTNWGEKGFFRMARGKNMCGIADWASYPVSY